MRVIVCGSRDWTGYGTLVSVLGVVRDAARFTLVHGAARGADSMAAHWASDWGITTEAFPANWAEHGKGAGPRRNAAMLAAGADAVIAFSTTRPATTGTGDMCRRALAAGVPVTFVSADGRITYHDAPSQLFDCPSPEYKER